MDKTLLLVVVVVPPLFNFRRILDRIDN